jgi:hypothetical protein
VVEGIKTAKKDLLALQKKHNQDGFKNFKTKWQVWFCTNPKQFFKTVNKKDNNRLFNAVVGVAEEQGHVIFGNKVKTAAHSFYEQLYKCEHDSAPLHLFNNDVKLVSNSDNLFCTEEYNLKEMESITNHLPNGKGVGIDGLLYEVYKRGTVVIRSWMITFINKCQGIGHFPRCSNVVASF